MNIRNILITLFAVCVIAAPSSAQHTHAGDVILAFDDWKLVTGVMDNRTFKPERLWIVDMDDEFIDDPGYDAPAGTFEPNSSAGILITKALRKWNEAEEHFSDIPAETLVIGNFNDFIETPASDPSPSEWLGLQLGVVGSSGSLHVHPFYWLTSPASDGIYLLELRFWNTLGVLPTTFTSDPFWIIFVKGNFSEKEIHEAEEWVEDNLIDTPIACVGDLDGNGVVDGFDLLELLGAWGRVAAGHPADLNNDGVVDGFDLLTLLGNWGSCAD